MSDRIRIGIVTTHPIQYQIPWFQALAAKAEVDLKVYYGLIPDPRQQGIGFGVAFQWDVPMLEGYAWTALDNARARPALGRFFGSSTPGVLAALANDRRDVVIITGWNALPLLQALWACVRLGVPRIVRGESNAMKARPFWIKVVHRLLLRRYDAVLAIGESNKLFYLANDITDSRIFSVPYFVDNGRFAAAARALKPERYGLRRQWGIPEDAVCFLFAGKLEPKKRILDLVGAIAQLKDRVAGVHLLVVGDGVLREQAQGVARRARISISFAGFLNQSEMPRAYVAADCLVLPSDYGETWGLVVNEAMACGLPAVVSDRVGCGTDLVTHNQTGMVFPFGDVRALAWTLESLAADPEALAQMGARASERASGYSVERAVEGTLEAVRYVLRAAQ